MQRRVFVKDGALALVTMGLSPSFLRRATFAHGAAGRAQGEGPDLPVPARRGRRAEHGRPARRKGLLRRAAATSRFRARARANARRRSTSTDSSDCIRRWRRSSACIATACSRRSTPWEVPSATRSHFDAQDYMESGTPDRKATQDGWLNRYLAVKGTCEECASAGVAVPRGRDDAADAAHPRRSGGRGRDELARRVHRARRRQLGRPSRSAVSHRRSGPRPRRGSRDVRRGEDAAVRESAAVPAGERRGVSAVAVRPAADARSRSSSSQTWASKSRSPTLAAGTRT